MDYNKVANEEDGLRLTLERRYTLADLQEYVKDTCLAEKFAKLLADETTTLEALYKHCIELLRDELNLDEITVLFVVACILYFVNATAENMEWRTYLLEKTFNYVDTLNPIHLHVATKRLWLSLKKNEFDVLNILVLCNQMAIASETGRCISICLVWAILSEITATSSEMFCFRKFSKLIEMLREIDDEVLQDVENSQYVYILVRAFSFLVNAVVFGRNSDLDKVGYRHYFIYTCRDLEKLKDWSEHLHDLIEASIRKTQQYWDLRMLITEYINLNLKSVLQEKILELRGDM